MNSGHKMTAKVLIVFFMLGALLNHACDKSRESYQPHNPSAAKETESNAFTEPLTGMQFILIRGGCYKMGDVFGDGDRDENPVHEVCVDNYYIGKYEVTQEQWLKIMHNNPSDFQIGGSYPVEQVSWHDVTDLITRYNQLTGKTFRLPTEAEWEYAARDRGEYEKFSGFSDERELFRYANFCDANCENKRRTETQNDKFRNTALSGSHKPDRQGLYDMTGNVWEWVQDWYDPAYYKNSPKNNPRGPGHGQLKVIRGGAWDSGPREMRAANRDSLEPERKSNNIGFRLVMSAK